jgi:SpoVK/Ycf46/Vps4 family AAA+-type ATPase
MKNKKILAVAPDKSLALFIGVDEAAEHIGVTVQDVIDALERRKPDVNGWELTEYKRTEGNTLVIDGDPLKCRP